MRRVHTGTLTGLLALAALLALPLEAGAQGRTMRFRAVPPESVSKYERNDRAAAQAARDAGQAAAAEGERAAATAESLQAIPGLPEPPEPPTPTHSTTGDIVRFGSDVTIEEDQKVEGDVVSFGGDVEISGHVTGEVQAMGGNLVLRSTARVDGDVVCVGGRLTKEEGARVGGKQVIAGRRGGADKIPWWPVMSMLGAGARMMVHIVGMFIMLGFAWAFVKLAPERTRGALDTISREPGPSFIIGLLLWALIIPSVIALALVIALLCITIIGIPLAAAVAVAYVAFFFLAALWGSVVGYGVLGARLFPRFKNAQPNLLQAVIWGGVAVHALRIAGDMLHVVPLFGVLGGLFTFMHFVIIAALGTIGAGALVRGEYRRRSVQNWWARMRPSNTGAGDMPGSPPPPPPPPPAPPAPPATSSGAEIIS